jgi:predicted metal-dependent hydrolase
MRYPEQYLQFIQKFNEGEYYECHDLLEELWMEDKSNKFLQGMLQLAVGLYHLECGNIKGARGMFGNARKYLSRYRPVYWDLDVNRVLEYLKTCLDALPEVDMMPYTEAKSLPIPALRLSLLQE